MNRVFCFSATGHCMEIAYFFAEELRVPVYEIGGSGDSADTAVVVFPVHCQSLPEPVRRWLPRLRAENVVLIAAYGMMHPGSALYEAAQLVCGRVIAAASLPTGHSYLNDERSFDRAALGPILRRMEHPIEANIPRVEKQLFAGFAPARRSRMGVRISRSSGCEGCGRCTRRCPVGAMEKGVPGKGCIRCLRCVYECPRKALSFSLHPLMRFYLRKPRREETKIYL